MTTTEAKPDLDTAQNLETPAVRPFQVAVPQARSSMICGADRRDAVA